MTDPLSRLRRFLRELKRRKVYRAAAGYLVVAFVVLQLADLAADAFGFPGWFEPMVWVVAGLGFPIVLVVAWAFEMTPEGMRRTPEAGEAPAEPSSGGIEGWIVVLGILLLVGGGAWYMTAGGNTETATESAATTDTTATRTASTARDTAGPPRIAVLPFENIARDTGDAFFAQGMHEEVLNQLSKVSGLEVISRTSVMGYADTEKRVPEISRELGGVDALMEGTVRRAGDRVRITTQLIKAPEDAHLWSNTYERALSVDAVFDIQADIAEKIAGALETQLAEGERRRIEDAPTDDLAAYDAYLQGRSHYFEHWATLEPADLRRSLDAFREAIQRDSAFAEAHAWLGLAYGLGAHLEGWLDSASVATERARAIEPDLVAAHLAQAFIYEERDSTSARIASLRRALELQPSHGFAKSELSDALRNDGQYVAALRVAREAVQLAPRQPVVLQEMGDQLRSVGFYDAAAAWNRHILEIEPGHYEAIQGLALTQLQRGRPQEALATWHSYLERTDAPTPTALFFAARAALGAGQPEQAKVYLERRPDAARQRFPEQAESASELVLPGPGGPAIRGHRGLAVLQLGNRARGRELLRQAADSLRTELPEREASTDTAVSIFRRQVGLAEMLAGLGQREQALDQLEASETALRRVTGQFLESPFFDDDLRSDSRFQEIVREVEAEREKLREEVRQLGIDLYPPGAEPDTASTTAGG